MSRIFQLLLGVFVLLILATIFKHFTDHSDHPDEHAHHATHTKHTEHSHQQHNEELIAITESLSVAAPKAKATIPGTKVSAGYATLVNHSDTDIILVSARSDVAAHTELHHMVMENSRMSMRQVDNITVPAHGQFELTPGGYHIMFMQLNDSLVAGQIVTVELIDDQNNAYAIEMPVLDMSNTHSHAH